MHGVLFGVCFNDLFSGGYQWTITLLKAKTKALSIKQTSSCSYLLVGENFDRERPFLELESSQSFSKVQKNLP